VDPHLVYVIPNAIISQKFKPNPALADPSCSKSMGVGGFPSIDPRPTVSVTIVVVSRLVYRKGIDLLVAATPHICELFPDVKFIIGRSCTVQS
jgi:phosphatidylinositol glycan class A protein